MGLVHALVGAVLYGFEIDIIDHLVTSLESYLRSIIIQVLKIEALWIGKVCRNYLLQIMFS
jgi:hypothetical protein